MQQHEIEIADGSDSCCLICLCGREFIAASWEEAGRKFDEHQNENISTTKRER